MAWFKKKSDGWQDPMSMPPGQSPPGLAPSAPSPSPSPSTSESSVAPRWTGPEPSAAVTGPDDDGVRVRVEIRTVGDEPDELVNTLVEECGLTTASAEEFIRALPGIVPVDMTVLDAEVFAHELSWLDAEAEIVVPSSTPGGPATLYRRSGPRFRMVVAEASKAKHEVRLDGALHAGIVEPGDRVTVTPVGAPAVTAEVETVRITRDDQRRWMVGLVLSDCDHLTTLGRSELTRVLRSAQVTA